MPKIHLKPQFVANPPRPTDKPKIDYFDTALSGFMLEVRQTGTATYYIRYRDKGGYIRQIKIGTPDTMSVKQHRKVTHHRRPILTPSERVCKHPARGLCDDRTSVTGWMSFASVSSSRFLSR